MYAVIDLSGKQQKVEKNEIIRIEKINKNIGDKVDFDRIMMLNDDSGDIKIGTPYIDGALVKAEVISQDRDKKIRVFKKKRRKSYTKTIGHRQYFTAVKIEDIILN